MKKRSVPQRVKEVQELRRSSASQPMKNKSKYSRKVKHKGLDNY